MRHLMCNAHKDIPHVVLAGGLVEHQIALEHEDRAPVLHGTKELAFAGTRDEIEFGEGVFHAEIVFKVRQQARRGIERILNLRALAAPEHDADIDSIDLAWEAVKSPQRKH